ncbi:ribosomal maturation YjgA family protein [Spirosoma pulveris]
MPTQPPVNRNRLLYGLLVLCTILIGLASRYFFSDVQFIKSYVGDALWALMVYFGLAFLFTRWSVKTLALVSIIFSFSIEVSQLYHAPWIDSWRATRLGGLVLGFTFVWSDLLCYSAGVLFGVVMETYLLPIQSRVVGKTGV